MLSLLALLVLLANALASDAPKGSWKYLRFDYFHYICNDGITENNAIAADCPLELQEPVYTEWTKCLCTSEVYLLTLLGCATEITSNYSYPPSVIADTYNSFGDICAQEGTKLGLTLEEAWAKLQSTTLISYEEANTTLAGPFETDFTLIDDALVRSGYETHFQAWFSELAGMITIWYLMFIVLLQTIMHWGAYIMPGFVRIISNNPLSRKLRKHLVLPALFGKSRANPVKLLRYFLLCFPPRLHAFFFAGYLFLCIFFLAFHYDAILSPLWYPTKVQYITGSVAYRSGQLAMYKMPLVFLFAGRNNILIWFTGWQMEIFNHWHRWIARLLTIDIIIHAVCYSVDFAADDGYYTEAFKEAYFNWGIVALFMFSFLCLNGTKTLRQMAYECFLYLHIVMAALSVVGTYWHISMFKGFLNIYPVIAFWAFDRLVRLVRILISGPFSRAHVVAHPHGVLEVDVKYSGLWQPRAGTYVFIHFLSSPLYAFQSHPFTIVDGDHKGEFKLYCKVLNGVTRQLQAKTLNNGGAVDTRVLVEGPYGVEFATKMFKEVVLFAGGVGITAVYSHLKHVEKMNTPGQILHVHWAISNNDPLTWFRKELDYMASLSNVNITVHLNDGAPSLEEKKGGTSDTISISNVSVYKVVFVPDFDALISEHCTNSQGPIVFFVCGPAPMSDAIRAGVAKNMLKTANYVQFYEESFSM